MLQPMLGRAVAYSGGNGGTTLSCLLTVNFWIIFALFCKLRNFAIELYNPCLKAPVFSAC